MEVYNLWKGQKKWFCLTPIRAYSLGLDCKKTGKWELRRNFPKLLAASRLTSPTSLHVLTALSRWKSFQLFFAVLFYFLRVCANGCLFTSFPPFPPHAHIISQITKIHIKLHPNHCFFNQIRFISSLEFFHFHITGACWPVIHTKNNGKLSLYIARCTSVSFAKHILDIFPQKMAMFVSFLFFFLVSSATACDRCVHQSKAAYFSQASALSCNFHGSSFLSFFGFLVLWSIIPRWVLLSENKIGTDPDDFSVIILVGMICFLHSLQPGLVGMVHWL